MAKQICRSNFPQEVKEISLKSKNFKHFDLQQNKICNRKWLWAYTEMRKQAQNKKKKKRISDFS